MKRQTLMDCFLMLRDLMINRQISGTHRCSRVLLLLSCITLLFSVPDQTKPLNVRRSNNAIPVFITGSISFRRPRQPHETPSSWPQRHASTRLGPTCVADRVVSFPAGSPSTTVRNRLVTPAMTSGTSSRMPSMSMSEAGGVGLHFGKGGR